MARHRVTGCTNSPLQAGLPPDPTPGYPPDLNPPQNRNSAIRRVSVKEVPFPSPAGFHYLGPTHRVWESGYVDAVTRADDVASCVERGDFVQIKPPANASQEQILSLVVSLQNKGVIVRRLPKAALYDNPGYRGSAPPVLPTMRDAVRDALQATPLEESEREALERFLDGVLEKVGILCTSNQSPCGISLAFTVCIKST